MSRKHQSKHENESNQLTVWKLRFNLGMQDPEMSGTRYHTTIFVETDPDGSGVMYHVVGDITSGMTYQKKSSGKPDYSQTFNSKEFLGYTNATTHPGQWDSVLRAVPPPPKQKAFNTKTMKTEQVKTWQPLAFFEPGEARMPLMKCTEWTEQRAIPALEQAGLITSVTAGSSSSMLYPSQSQSGSSGSAGDWVWDYDYQRYRRWSQSTNNWVWQQ